MFSKLMVNVLGELKGQAEMEKQPTRKPLLPWGLEA